jgi:hypothetical protein
VRTAGFVFLVFLGSLIGCSVAGAAAALVLGAVVITAMAWMRRHKRAAS